jgi:HD superfamily phosphohydrolase
MEKNFITIRDPIHGQIDLNQTEQKILDSTIFQRLRGIKQVGLTYLVYPGAHHTRFEHSLGSLFLANKFGLGLQLTKEELYYVRLAALLHDIGHMAFSHDSETVVKKFFNKNHEQIGEELILNSELKEIIEKEGFCPKTIIQLIKGKNFGKLISFEVGADRLDYLLRDAYYTGVAYGIIEWERIISTTKWKNNKPIISFGGLEAAESVLLARFSMFHTVYYHHTIRIARAMFQKALELALENRFVSLEDLKNYSDYSLFNKLIGFEQSKNFIQAINKRELYKRAFVLNWLKLSKSQKNFIKNQLPKELEKEFGTDALVLLPENFSSDLKLDIEDKSGELVDLKKISPLVSSLIKAAKARAFLIVCCKNGLQKKVNLFCKKQIS